MPLFLLLFFNIFFHLSEIKASDLGNIDTFIQETLDTFKIPGIGVGVISNEETLIEKGYGFRNLQKKLPVTEKTLFAIGSCSKAFTACLLAQLADQGKIKWDDPVIKYIPELRFKDWNTTQQVSIRDLIAHRTGLARYDTLWYYNPQISSEEFLQRLAHFEFAYPLREKFLYNNWTYALAGIALKRITGQSWDQRLKSEIFIPLKMNDSNSSIEDTQKSNNFATPYTIIDDELRILPFHDLTPVAPAGAINSNISDMLKWMQFQLSNGTLNGSKLMNSESLQEMHILQMPLGIPPQNSIYFIGTGLGWGVGMYRGNYALGHEGGIDGFISSVVLIPQKKIGVVVLTNSSSHGHQAASAITNTIVDRLLNASDKDWIQHQKEQHETENPPSEQPKKIPSPRTLNDYVGLYENPAYGTLEIGMEQGQLTATYGEMKIPLHHLTYDIFQSLNEEEVAYGKKPNLTFSFFSNAKGEIEALHIPFNEIVKPAIFQRIK